MGYNGLHNKTALAPHSYAWEVPELGEPERLTHISKMVLSIVHHSGPQPMPCPELYPLPTPTRSSLNSYLPGLLLTLALANPKMA